jgi:hypothetical protein
VRQGHGVALLVILAKKLIRKLFGEAITEAAPALIILYKKMMRVPCAKSLIKIANSRQKLRKYGRILDEGAR